MDWSDSGFILAAKPYGESSLLVSLLTEAHGRHAGLVKGGATRRNSGLYQSGNEVLGEWRARLAEHLGNWRLELKTPWSAGLLDTPDRLAALSAACAMADAALPEREPHPAVHAGFRILLAALDVDSDDWPLVYVRWELGLLAELGFGLDLDHCAATGAIEDLTHVSPKSGRAVSAAAAAPYREKLFRLPGFLAGGRGGPPANDAMADIRDGLALTGFFLERHVFQPHRQALPTARARLLERIAKASAITGISGP